MASRYAQTYGQWKANPEAFWAEAAKAIDWIKPPQKIFDGAAGVYGRWFPDATCNMCYNALDRHADGGRGNQTALIYDSPVTNSKRQFTYSQLRDEVAALASVLQDFGVVKGDRVVIYMPMIAEAVMAMLACARIGAVHSGWCSAALPQRSLPHASTTPSRKINFDSVLRHRARSHRQIQAAA